MRRQSSLAFGICIGIAAIGCGGGGGGAGDSQTDGSSIGGDTSGAAAPKGTAQFRVDVETGEVRVTNPDAPSRSIFSGGLVTFQSTTLIDEPGNIGRRP